MRKLIKLVTFAAMMASWCVRADTWTDPATGIEWSYKVADGNASIGIVDNYITAVSRSTNGDLAIPSLINGLPVTGINSLAFLSCTGLTSVTIPMSVTRIGNQAFSGCEKLKTVKIPSSVTSWSWGLFTGCGALTQIAVDEDNPKVKFLNGVLLSRDGKRLYEGVNGDIVIPAGVVIIEGCAFEGRKGLTSVTMPSSVEIVGDCAFRYCEGLRSVEMQSGVRDIGGCAFEYCSSLQEVAIPSSVKCIGESAFAGSGLTSIVMPYQVAVIEDSVFQSCGKLRSVEIPNGVESIGRGAFNGCSMLTEIAIPASVTNIFDSSFSAYASGCSSLVQFLVDADNPSYKSQDGLLLTKDGKHLIRGVNGDVVIPDGVTSVGAYAFSGCQELLSVSIPSGVTNVGSLAFMRCRGLRSLTLPSGIRSIGEEAFHGCSGLTSIVVPPAATEIGKYSFFYCSGLSKVTIPSSVTCIGAGAFNWCDCLKVVYASQLCAEDVIDELKCYGAEIRLVKAKSGLPTVSFNATGGSCQLSTREVVGDSPIGSLPVAIRDGYEFIGWFTEPEDGVQVSSEEIVTGDVVLYAHWQMSDGGPYTEVVDGIEWTYVVSNGEASVGTGAYHGTAVPVSFAGPLTIPATLGGHPVTGINSCAFESCSGLTSATIPPGVTSIGDYAFSYCYDLQSVTIPSSVKCIGKESFRSCWGLISAVIPSGVTSIGEWAFEYCYRLTSVTVPSSVTSIGRGAFGGCNSLTEILVDVGNQVYASSDGVLCDKTKGALAQCPAGKEGEMSISAYVTSIEASAFQGCRGLTTVTIPSSVTNIGHWAFDGCTGLTTVRIPVSVTSIDEGSFVDCSNLAMLEVDSNNKFYASFDGILCNKAKTEVIQCPAGKTGTVVIPASVTNIWGHAFSGCSRLTSVTIPDSVTHIGVNAFTGCRGLTSVTIPSSVTSLSFGVFESCAGLTLVVIPQGVTAIGCFSFAYCSDLTSVVIPSSVTRIYYCAFASCSGLRSVTLPSGVTTIEERAFSRCKGMISVVIPKSVTNIGDSAFDACDALKTVYVAEGDAGRVRGMIEASGFDTSDLKFETVDPEPTVWKVSFDANGGACSGAARDVVDGAALGELPVPIRNGYEFLGWFTAAEGGQKVTVETIVESDATWYAHWTPIQYDIVYSGLRGASNPNPTSYTIEDAVVFAALPDVDGWTFSGWSIAGIAVGNTGDITVRANWEKGSPSIDPGEDDEPMDVSIANTYDGVIVDADGLPMGYINVKAAKASGKGAARACTVTATIQMVGEVKKVTVKGKVPVDEAAMVAAAKDGRILDLNFSKYGIWGTFDDYAVEGVRNLLQSTAKSDDGTAAKRAAENAFARFKGNYVLAYGDEYGYNGLSLNVMAKGAVKVSGKLANGVSVSTTSQLIVGEYYSVIPVIYTKGDSSLAFNVYFANDGTDTFVFGTYDAEIAPVGALSSGLSFYTGEAISELFDDDYTLLDEFLPNGVSVEPNGKKWIVVRGAAAGKIKVIDGEAVDTKESENPSGLKLTFNMKAGTFSGSFKVYALDVKDKLKTFTATVNGVVVDGCGYGTATIKGRGSCAVVVAE